MTGAVYVRFSRSVHPGDPDTLTVGPCPDRVDPAEWPFWWVSPNGNYCLGWNFVHEDGRNARELWAFKEMELIR